MSARTDLGGPVVEPDWLSATEQAAWLRVGALVTRLPAALDADLRATSGLSLFEYLVLALLSEAPDRTMRMSELGPAVSASPSRLSHGVARLERRGWVRRAPLPADGRQITATLTPGGYRKVAATAPEHVRFVRKVVVDVLTGAQLRELDATATVILDAVDAAAAECRAGAAATCAGEADPL